MADLVLSTLNGLLVNLVLMGQKQPNLKSALTLLYGLLFAEFPSSVQAAEGEQRQHRSFGQPLSHLHGVVR
jgi:hypothetical protein